MAIPVPDLNPLENEWAELKRRSTNMDLERFYLEEWSLISCQVFSKLIRHYRRRFRAVILEKGGCKKYSIKGDK